MKRVDLIKRIATAAKRAGKTWVQQRPAGSKHEVWVCGSTKVTVPRHRELNEFTAEGIMKHLEVELGEGWWR